MRNSPLYRRFLFSIAMSLMVATGHVFAATPEFTVSGISDEALMENLPYTSNSPIVDGNISGGITYSLLNTLDPVSDLSDLAIFEGKNIIQILLIFFTDDSSDFSINSTTGVVSMVGRDFELPEDANSDNIYKVTLVATDDAGHRNTLSWNIEILDQPAVVFTLSGINSRSLNENANYTFPAPNLSGSSIGPITYSLSGNDAGYFSVDSTTGAVSFTGRDFENPLDADADNIYEVTLTGTDTDNNTGSISWTVTILNLPPLVFNMSSISVTHHENEAYSSPKPAISGSFRGPLTYSISGGADAALFSIDSLGIITLAAQDFYVPIDANADNIYEVSFTATDTDNNSASATLSVTITESPLLDDSDGDGVLNIIEIAENTNPFNASSFKDTDDDGIADVMDTDADNDGILNAVDDMGHEPYTDNDIDGVPDYLDADDRGDGIVALCTDADTNDICDPGFALDPRFDSDQDGRANHADFDSDNDYLPDAIEGNIDTDGDSIPDYLDTDSDNDYIPDIIESGVAGDDDNFNGIADYFDASITAGADINDDGIDDDVVTIDSDEDGIANYLDLDSDNDLVPDVLEGTQSSDSDQDGIDDQFDVDNSFGFDINNDGIDDLWALPDTDGDGVPDYIDNDSDNDGIGDQIESGSIGDDVNTNGIDDHFDITFNPTGIDNNSDGVVEDTLPDSDSDGAADHRDLDSDNDSIPDTVESGTIDFNLDALKDFDTLVSLPLPDEDADLIPDYLDIDNNGDLVIEDTPFSAFDNNTDGRIDMTSDPDLDGIDNSIDTAPAQFGLLPITPPDWDGDGIPDSVDPDIDGDSISNIVEGDDDTDNDGITNDFDKDSDNDGISDLLESAAPVRIGDNNTNGIDDSVDVLVTGGDDLNSDGIDDAFNPVDSDGDTFPNYLDGDSDNDGHSDRIETSGIELSLVDVDIDGIDDAFDVTYTGGLDVNRDGISDTLITITDSDSDGIPDYLDLDSDNDTVSDAMEGSGNADNDFLPDRIDTDSDADGISDYIESGNPALIGDDNDNGIDDSVDVLVTGGTDANGDGIDDSFNPVDTDGDGTADYIDEDSDADTIDDIVEGTSDTDSDGIANFRDKDSDNDFIPDIIEGTVQHDQDGIPDYLDNDSDADGIPDIVEGGTGAVDSDADGIANLFDVSVTGGTDANGDGIDDDVTALDTDSDSLPNYIDNDSDNDRIPDALEGSSSTDTDIDGIDDAFDVDITMGTDANNDGIDDSLYLIDTDGDGSPDAYDTDSDNDGIGDAVESLSLGIDANDNDIDDAFDAQIVMGTDDNNDSILEDALPDTDGDGVLDHHDLDSDNDSLTDVFESGGLDANVDGFNDLLILTTPPLPNADADLLPDYREVDSDNDGNFDIEGTTLAAFDTNNDGKVDITADPDGDGVDSSVDSLPLVYGLLPGAADMDDDNDNISDVMEGGIDSDTDGIINSLDQDSDNDGISDFIESGFPFRVGDSNNNGLDDSVDVLVTGGDDLNADGVDDLFHPVDTDRDGIPDYIDNDADNDGLTDLEEIATIVLSGDDDDNDGIDNVFDVDSTGGLDLDNDGIDDAVILLVDTDDDGLYNHLDTDSDNDGFLDGVENDDVNGDGIPDRLQPEGKVKGSSGSGSANPLLLLLLAILMAGKQAFRRSAMLLAALAIFSTNTFAEEEIVCRDYKAWPDNKAAFAPCFYVGMGLGISQLDPDTSDSSWVAADDADSGFNLYGGYHFSHSWFVELMYADLGETTVDNKHILVTQQESIGYQAFSVFGGYYLPFDDLFKTEIPVRFFIKAGVAQLGIDASSSLIKLDKDNHTVLAAGLGIEWPFLDNWMLRGEVDTFSAEAKLFNVSVGYWFGGKKHYYEVAKPKPEVEAAPETVAEAAPVVEPEPVVEETPKVVEEIAAIGDADKDGVIDTKDDCPNTPPKSRVDIRGCASYKGYVQSLYGAFNSTDLTYPSYGLLDTVILLLKGYPDTRIEIQAHTDDRGSNELNQRLSEQRAEVVKAYLVEKGIHSSRIETQGFGESKPLADNATAQGRSKNRRIDFKVLNK